MPPVKQTIAEKRAILRTVQGMISPEREGGPLPLLTALARVGVSSASFYRWCDAEASGAWDREKSKGGRPVRFTLTPAEIECLRWFTERHDSPEFAVKRFAAYAHADMVTDAEGRPACPHAPAREEVRQQILADIDAARRDGRRYHPPLSLLRAARTTEATGAARRGRKKVMNVVTSVPHGDFWIDEGGRRLPLLPGCGFVSDDMSLNQPFRYELPGGASGVGRQMLATMDIASLAWLGANQVGRVKDAYRVQDIAEHFEAIVSQHGWPAWWTIERGPWDNNFVWGCGVPEAWGEPDGFAWGGITMFTRVKDKFTPRGKSEIEQGFNRLQKWLAQSSVDIGRHRGEFEAATRIHARAVDGDEAALARLWTVYQAAEAVAGAMHADNNDDHARAAWNGRRIVPAQWWQEAAAGVCTPLKASDRWVFSPVKEALTVWKDGTVRHSREGYGQFVFNVSGVFRGLQEMDRGHRVFVAFHPDAPERGCHVFNAERASVRNRDGLRHGEFLGVAPFVERVARETFAPGGKYDARDLRTAAVRNEVRAIIPGKPGEGINRASLRTGRGDSATVERGTAPAPAEDGLIHERPPLPELDAPRPSRGGVAALLSSRRAVRPVATPEPVTAGTADPFGTDAD